MQQFASAVLVCELSTASEEEQEWRDSTEMLLNLPPSESIALLYEVLKMFGCIQTASWRASNWHDK